MHMHKEQREREWESFVTDPQPLVPREIAVLRIYYVRLARLRRCWPFSGTASPAFPANKSLFGQHSSQNTICKRQHKKGGQKERNWDFEKIVPTLILLGTMSSSGALGKRMQSATGPFTSKCYLLCYFSVQGTFNISDCGSSHYLSRRLETFVCVGCEYSRMLTVTTTYSAVFSIHYMLRNICTLELWDGLA